VHKEGIARGIQEGFFGYSSGSTPILGNDAKYQVPLSRVRFNTVVGEDEIDMDSGFLMMPQAVARSVAVTGEARARQTYQVCRVLIRR